MVSRYDRQLLLPEIGVNGQRKLSAARVAVVGIGGLGSPVATYLTGAGVGTLALIDDDVVSITNLQRQVLYDESQEGLPKVDCAKARLQAMNSSISVVAHHTRLTEQNAMQLLANYDIVVDGTDNFSARFAVSDACCRLGIPYVYGAVNALEGQVSVLCCGHATYRTLYPDEQATLAMPHPGKAVVGVTPALVGSVQASQVLQLVCGYGTPLVDKLWTVDLRTLQTFVIDL